MGSFLSKILPVISVGGSVLGGFLGSGASKSAANTQTAAGQQAIQTLIDAELRAMGLQTGAYNTGVAYQTPYAQTGYAANRYLAELLGITPPAPSATIPTMGVPSVGGGGGGGLNSPINLAASPGVGMQPTGAQKDLGDVMGAVSMGTTAAGAAGLLGAAGAAGPIGLAAAGLAYGVPKLVGLAQGPDSYEAGSKEVLRDFGVNVSDAQVKQLIGDLGFSEEQAWPIRKDILTSPQALIALGSLAQQQGTLPQFLSKLSDIDTGWQDNYNFADAFKKGMNTGDWSELNTSYNDAFKNSKALQAANPNWQQALDVATGSSGAPGATGQAPGSVPGGLMASPYAGMENVNLPSNMMGALLDLSGFSAPSTADINAMLDPSMAFQADQINKAIQATAAARGTLMSGGTAKSLANYIQGLTSTTWQQAYQNAMQNKLSEYNSKVQAKQNLYSNLLGLSGAGQNAAGAITNAGNTLGSNLAQTVLGTGQGVAGLQTGIGNVKAAGQVGSGNAWTNAIQNIIKGVSGYDTLSKGLNQNVGGGGAPVVPVPWNSGMPLDDYSTVNLEPYEA